MQSKTKSINIITTRAITMNLFLKDIVKKLSNKYEVTLICKDPNKLEFKNLKKKKINFPLELIEILNLKKLYICIRELYSIASTNNDLYFIHTPIASIFFRLVNIFRNIKILYFVHGYRFHNQKKMIEYLFLIIEYILAFKTKYYININKKDFQFTKKILKKKTILVNGVGIEISKKRKKINKKKINKACIISAYKKEKGYSIILDHAKKINYLFPQLKIDCYGYGNLTKEFGQFEKSKLTNIRFFKFKKNIESVIKKYDFLIHPSFREGLPVSIIQCMSLGLPVIGRDIRGVNDLVKNNYNGLIFKKDSDLLICISKMLNLKKFNLLSKNAKKKIDKSYSQDFISKKIKKYIDEII